jgi:hypothetical protein
LYTTREDVSRRLADTIVALNNEPVHIYDVGGRGPNALTVRYRMFPFDGSEVGESRVDNPEFNKFKPIPLGFINAFELGSQTYFAQRIPMRQSRQGLSSQSFTATALDGSNRLGLDHLRISEGFREMVAGVYPTFDEAVTMLIPGSSIAVSREFALAKSNGGYVTLYYKKEEVGFVFRDQLYLQADKQFLLEMIIENPNLPNNVEIM